MKFSKFTLFFTLFFFWLISCNNVKSVEGDWIAIDSQKSYAEMAFSTGQLRIYHENAGYMSPKNYMLRSDSLIAGIGAYHITWISNDSVLLESRLNTISLKRITDKNKLSEVNVAINMSEYQNSFYNRRAMWKNDILPNDSIPALKEECIEIKKAE